MALQHHAFGPFACPPIPPPLRAPRRCRSRARAAGTASAAGAARRVLPTGRPMWLPGPHYAEHRIVGRRRLPSQGRATAATAVLRRTTATSKHVDDGRRWATRGDEGRGWATMGDDGRPWTTMDDDETTTTMDGDGDDESCNDDAIV